MLPPWTGLWVTLFTCTNLPLNTAISLKNQQHQNISELLDSLLEGYDNTLRPDFGGPPTVVEIDINVRSMGPVSEIDMTYSMDCYFRQTWVDRRLSFTGSMDTMTLSISMLERIWKPDTYFYNGKLSYVHVITVPNKFVRLNQDGRVLYSQRLTIQASCPMNLENFPMDSQRCPLKVGSFGYSQEDVRYQWNANRQVVIASDMKMSQFDLIDTPSGSQTDSMKNGEFSTLVVSFHLQRHMGYFLIQVYAPCILLVVLSWVAFWINREATADRVALGVTTVLTMTFLGLESRSDLPKVSYSTALDIFVALSFFFVFATIIQFALVHYFTKVGSGEPLMASDTDASSDESEDGMNQPGEPLTSNAGTCAAQDQTRLSPECPVFTTEPFLSQPLNGTTFLESGHTSGAPEECACCLAATMTRDSKSFPAPPSSPLAARQLLMTPRRHSTGMDIPLTRGRHHQQEFKRRRPRRRMIRAELINSVSKIDQASRVLFPLSFLVINIVYWYLFLSRTYGK